MTVLVLQRKGKCIPLRSPNLGSPSVQLHVQRPWVELGDMSGRYIVPASDSCTCGLATTGILRRS